MSIRQVNNFYRTLNRTLNNFYRTSNNFYSICLHGRTLNNFYKTLNNFYMFQPQPFCSIFSLHLWQVIAQLCKLIRRVLPTTCMFYNLIISHTQFQAFLGSRHFFSIYLFSETFCLFIVFLLCCIIIKQTVCFESIVCKFCLRFLFSAHF